MLDATRECRNDFQRAQRVSEFVRGLRDATRERTLRRIRYRSLDDHSSILMGRKIVHSEGNARRALMCTQKRTVPSTTESTVVNTKPPLPRQTPSLTRKGRFLLQGRQGAGLESSPAP